MEVLKVLRFVFSLISALWGGASAAYTMCFQLNVFVPITVDYYPPWHKPPSLNSYPIINDALLLAMFYVSHSLLARDSVKQMLHVIIPESIYRPVYVLCSGVVLLILAYCWQPFGPYIWRVEWTPIIWLLWVVNGLNLTFLCLAFISIEPLTFIGILTSNNSSITVAEEKPKLVQNGLYRLVRHPMYTGVIVSNWAVPVMTLGHLMFSFSATAYMWLAVVYLEEPNLIKTFGKEYHQYMQKTPRFFPDIWKQLQLPSHLD